MTGDYVSIGAFEVGDSALGALGAWSLNMSFPAEQPIEELNPPRGDSSGALHLAGVAGASGNDYSWHAAAGIDQFATGVRFWARSDLAPQTSTVALMNAVSNYWEMLESSPPPAIELTLSSEWQQFELSFEELLGEREAAPPGSGLHFLTAPDAAFDVWLDDVELRVIAR